MLAGVDIAIIVLVLAGGLVVHGVDPIADIRHTVGTVTPFVVGWLLAGPAVGAYSPRARTHLTGALLFVALAWGLATIVGSGLRSSALFPGGAPPIFLAVTFGTGMVVLGPWRMVVVGLQRLA